MSSLTELDLTLKELAKLDKIKVILNTDFHYLFGKSECTVEFSTFII